MPADAYLIIDQQSSPSAQMPELLKELAARHDLDGYRCRQQLLGQTEALLTRGPVDKLAKINTTLTNYNFNGHIITPSQIQFAPFILTRVEINNNELSFFGREKSLIIPRDARVLIILAELSGSLVERNLSQILSAHRYTGNSDNSGLPLEKWQRTILQGRPVLDIYLLNEQGIPTGAVRAFPGKFDHRGLGEHATLSANQNLLKLVELSENYAAQHRLDMRFGISPLPGASLQPAKADDLVGLKKNLHNLTRYAWLQTDIDSQKKIPAQDSDAEAIAMATTGLLTALHPELAANLPLQQELAAGLCRKIDSSSPASQAEDTDSNRTQALPTPPAAQRHNIWTSPGAIAGYGLATIITLLSALDDIGRWLTPLASKAFSSGTLSGVLAAALLTAGFRRLHIKRLIENTPTSKIRSIAMGRVEVHGRARRQYALVSPMSHSACIYYRLSKYKRNHKNHWVVSSITSSGHVPFWLEDESGRVSVDPGSATIKSDHRQESLGEGTLAFAGFSDSSEKWIEELIYDGALVYVLGEAQVKKNQRAPRQQRRAEALRRIKQDKQRLSAYDTNNDGNIDESEWQAARDEVDEQLLHEDLGDSKQRRRQEDLVVITKSSHRGVPFVIAETPSEEKLTGGYTWGIGFLFCAAAVCSGLTIWLLLQNF